jgi:predicted Zn-dependent protease
VSVPNRVISLLAVGALMAGALSPEAHAEGGVSYIRDAEIENTIRTYATPLFDAAGLNASSIHLYMIEDNRLNSFVAGGMNIFMNTGLLMRSENADQVVGVIAHETGHIADGHLARTTEALRNATIESIIAMVAGAAAGIASGQGGAAAAVMSGGQNIAIRSLLAYSRVQESEADHAGVSYLDRAGFSSKGLLDFMKILQGEDALLPNDQDPYLRTHPLTSERIDYLQNHVDHSPLTNAPMPPGFDDMHDRMKAKLVGYLLPLNNVLRQYPESDTSLYGRYARAIAYYRVPDLNHAIPLIDGLIAEHPKDAYFQELKGQMLFENGKVQEALPYYERAVALQPRESLIRLELSQVQIELENPAMDRAALDNLLLVTRAEPKNAEAWRFLGIAYGRTGNIGMAALSLSESAWASGDRRGAREQADRASQHLAVNSPAWMWAQDILNDASRSEGEGGALE